MTGKRTVAYMQGHVSGAIPNGTKICKINSVDGDGHKDGATGVVLSSVGPVPFENRLEYGYFVLWDDAPCLPVAVVGHRIKEVPHAE